MREIRAGRVQGRLAATLARSTRFVTDGEYFTVWSWLLTLPFAVTILGAYEADPDAAARFTGFLAALGTHVVLGLVLCLPAILGRRVHGSAVRVFIVGASLAFIAVCRPALTDHLRVLGGLSPYAAPMPTRIVVNLIAATIALTLIAIAISGLRRRAEVLGALGRVSAALDEERTAGRRLVEAASRAVADVQAELRAALHRQLGGSVAAPASGWARRLRDFSEHSVRPLSHRLFAELDQLQQPTLLDGGLRPSRRRSLVLVPAPYGLAVGLYTLAGMPYVLFQMEQGARVPAVVITLAIGLLGDALARGLFRLVSSRWQSIVVIAVALATGGGIVAATTSIAGTRPSAVLEVLTYASIAAVCSLCTGVFRRLDEEEAALTTQLAAYTFDEFEGRQLADALLAHAARTLHGGVQGACVAAAMRVDTRSSGALRLEREEVLGTIATAIDRLSEPAAVPPPAAEDDIGAILEGWRHAMALTTTADASVWAALDRDPGAIQLMIDAITEGLTNVLRHGDEAAASIDLGASGDQVALEIRSSGRLHGGAAKGRGLADLRSRARAVRLEQHGEHVVLGVEVMVEPQPAHALS